MAVSIPDKITQFFTTYPLRTFDKRQLLIRPEERLSAIFYIIEGRVSEYDITPSGSEVVVNVFKPGAFFPVSTALNDTPNMYFFEATIKVKAHVAPAAAAVKFLEENPDVTLDLLKRVYRGVDGVLRRMTHLMGGTARHRLLFEILNAAYRFGELQKDGSLRLAFSEGELGRLSGLTRETVNRTTKAFKNDGLLEVSHKGIIIADIKKLEALLGDTV